MKSTCLNVVRKEKQLESYAQQRRDLIAQSENMSTAAGQVGAASGAKL